jgi:hypothetical protein
MQHEDIPGKLIEFLREHSIEIDGPIKVGCKTYYEPNKSRITIYGILTTLNSNSSAYRAYVALGLELLRDCKRNGARFIKGEPLDGI